MTNGYETGVLPAMGSTTNACCTAYVVFKVEQIHILFSCILVLFQLMCILFGNFSFLCTPFLRIIKISKMKFSYSAVTCCN